jgi:hypothetical protein
MKERSLNYQLKEREFVKVVKVKVVQMQKHALHVKEKV